MTAEVTVWGIPLPLSALLVARAFELWTHENDIRRVAGLPASVPDVSTLRLMTELATSMLPFGAMLAGLQGPINLRLVLTGPGGGTWDVVIGGDAPEPVAIGIVTDVVDFCRLAANRLNPADLDMHVTGDQGRAVGRAGGGLGAGARLSEHPPSSGGIRLIRRRARRRTSHRKCRTHRWGVDEVSVLVIGKFQGDTATFRQALADRAG